ncbi:MAG: hypothetical protein WCI47_02195, partial [bacterium]
LSVSAGYAHTCALLYRGEIACWGMNNSGQIGRSDGIDSAFPVKVQYLGSLITGATSVSAGNYGTCITTSIATVKCWGMYNGYGESESIPASVLSVPRTIIDQYGDPKLGLRDVSAGFYHACVVDSVGAVSCLGKTTHGELGNGTDTGEYRYLTSNASGLAGVTSISSGGDYDGGFTCAVVSGESVWCWGVNTGGYLGNGSNINSNVPVRVSGL